MTGLDYMNARYYDPNTGRFLSEDPTGFAAGDANLYRYVGNNPVNAIDPSGLNMESLGGLPSGFGSFNSYTPAMPNFDFYNGYTPSLSPIAIPLGNYRSSGALGTSMGQIASVSPSTPISSSPSLSMSSPYSSSLDNNVSQGALGNPMSDAEFSQMLPSVTDNLPLYTSPLDELLNPSYADQNPPQPAVVDVQKYDGQRTGDIYREPASAMTQYVNTTDSPFKAGLMQFFQPVVGIWGSIQGGLMDTVLPPSDPSYRVTCDNGDVVHMISPGPSSGALLAQGALIAGFMPWSRVPTSAAVSAESNLADELAAAPSSGASNANAGAALRSKLSGLQDAQETAAQTRVLPDGRIRYYDAEVPARTPGPTRGSSFVTESNPDTNIVRQWMESYGQSGNVVRVNPKTINGQQVIGPHYPPTGTEVR